LSVQFLEAEAMQRLAEGQGLEVIARGDEPTHPSVYYRHLHRFQACFIAGSLAQEADGLSECVAGAVVKLYQDGTLLDTAVSDEFGDFKFDGLTPDSGRYSIEIEYRNQKQKEIEVLLEGDLSGSTGTIWL
jgi:hypothetical protein